MQMLGADGDTMLPVSNESSQSVMTMYDDLSQRWTSIICRVQHLLKSDLAISEPGREQATKMVDLVEHLVQCFFILPTKADALLDMTESPS
ncbi:MAG: hypothetical protein JXA89_05580 [Anaerolineae bacterium]|nr:hypothetical protein [Anaerolineae bacterium]